MKTLSLSPRARSGLRLACPNRGGDDGKPVVNVRVLGAPSRPFSVLDSEARPRAERHLAPPGASSPSHLWTLLSHA